jgi:hypothetical protein
VYANEDELKDSNVYIFYLASSITLFRFKFDNEILNYYKDTFVLEKKSSLVDKTASYYTKKLEPSNKSNLTESERYKEIYLITGSASEENIRLLLKKKFNLDTYNPSTKEYSLSDDCIQIVVNCNLFRHDFSFIDFKNKCNEIKSDLKEIICLENLNPRPETLVDDMNILKKVFASKELKEKMTICFTSSQQKNLSEVQSYAKNFDFLFNDVLMIQNGSLEKEEYINKNIKTLDVLELINLNKKKTKNYISNQKEKEEYVSPKFNYYSNRNESQPKYKDNNNEAFETNDDRTTGCIIL